MSQGLYIVPTNMYLGFDTTLVSSGTSLVTLASGGTWKTSNYYLGPTLLSGETGELPDTHSALCPPTTRMAENNIYQQGGPFKEHFLPI